MTTPFVYPMPNPFMGPLAFGTTFSSFDQWVKEGQMPPMERPYKIVLLPGYRRPGDLDANDLDSLWFEEEVREPTVVWDGFSSLAMLEIIYECFDRRGPSDTIAVFETKTGNRVDEFRPELFLKCRPRKAAPKAQIEVHNHRAALQLWSCVTVAGRSLDETGEFYRNVREHGDSLRSTAAFYNKMVWPYEEGANPDQAAHRAFMKNPMGFAAETVKKYAGPVSRWRHRAPQMTEVRLSKDKTDWFSRDASYNTRCDMDIRLDELVPGQMPWDRDMRRVAAIQRETPGISPGSFLSRLLGYSAPSRK